MDDPTPVAESDSEETEKMESSADTDSSTEKQVQRKKILATKKRLDKFRSHLSTTQLFYSICLDCQFNG